MQDIKYEIRDFLIPFSIIWILAAIWLSVNEKIESHLILNSYHSPSLDLFFKYFTEIGGWFPFIVAAILLLFKWKISLFILIGQLIATLITTPLKHIIQAPRPSVIFNELKINLPLVDGVDLHSTLSFPSGHTSAAFAFCFAIAIFCSKWWQRVLCLILACLGGYSRIYLSQHFLQDILAGSIIGIIAILILIPFTKKYFSKATAPATK